MKRKNNQRTCILTRQKLDKSQLIRFIIINQEVVYDQFQNLPGRGIYLKNDPVIIAQFKQKQILQKRFKVQNVDSFFEKLI